MSKEAGLEYRDFHLETSDGHRVAELTRRIETLERQMSLLLAEFEAEEAKTHSQTLDEQSNAMNE